MTAGWLRERDGRAILLALLTVLIGIAITPVTRLPLVTTLLLVTAIAGHIPLGVIVRRSAVVLPFAFVIAVSGVPVRGWAIAAALIARAWLSAVSVVLAVESASAPRLFNALARLGCPQPLVTVVQFVYRFLFVLAGVVQNMRTAALARGLQRAGRRRAFTAAAGIIAVLFAAAHSRAARVHGAMMSRGYGGQIPSLRRERLRLADGALVIGAIALVLTIRSH